MSNTPSQKNRSNSSQRDSVLMEKWIDNQSTELQVQSERIKLSNKELEHDRAIAEKTIDAQLEDRSKTRTHTTKLTKYILIFLATTLLMLLLFGSFIIINDKEDLLSEIINLVIELFKYGIGAVTGYFIAKSKFKAESKTEKNS